MKKEGLDLHVQDDNDSGRNRGDSKNSIYLR